MLNFCQPFRRLHHSLQAFVVEFVRGRAGSASAKNGSHGDDVVFFGYILMDYIVGETSKGALSAVEEDFDLIGSRMLLYAFEDVGGLIVSKHSAVSIQQLAFSNWHLAPKTVRIGNNCAG